MKTLVSLLLLVATSTAYARFKTWTVLIYWAVDNDLYEFSLPYLEQFTRIPQSSNLNLVLEYDYPDHRPTERFHNFELIETIGERNSASPKTLTDFVAFGVENYPADNYVLIIASHGSNWSGVIDDTTSKSYMSLSSLRGALKKINSTLPKGKLDLLVFDTCLMSFYESLYTFGDQVDLMIGSAFLVNGFDHQTPLTKLAQENLSTRQLGEAYIESYPLLESNRGEANVGASMLASRPINTIALEKFFAALYDYDLTALYESLHKVVSEDEDWAFDLIALLRQSALLYPELAFEASMRLAELEPLILKSSLTPETVPHSGLGLTCAERLASYRKSPIGRALPSWADICEEWRR